MPPMTNRNPYPPGTLAAEMWELRRALRELGRVILKGFGLAR
jgi:hypothetical protein